MLRRANHRTTLPKTRTKIPRGETCCKFVCLRGSVAAIATLSAIINKINEISGSIASAVEEQNGTTSAIGRSIADGARGSSEIARSISGVAQAAQSTSLGAHELKKATVKLQKMSAELTDLVGQFSRAPHLPPRAARIELQRQVPQGRFPCASSHPPGVCRRYLSEPHQRPSQLPRTEMTLGTGGVT